jgi:hypothetical protein
MLNPLCTEGIRILETMHLTKGPVYVLLRGVKNEPVTFCAVLDALKTRPASFWTLEGEEEFSKACEFFNRSHPNSPSMRQDLERIWTKSRSYLQQRREQCERVIDSDLPAKRTRTESS